MAQAPQVVFGSISEFVVEVDDVTEWIERLEQWFLANKIEDATQQRALLLSNIGAKGYKLLRALSQNNPTAKTYDVLKQLLSDHINPKPNEIAQRFVFYRRDRRSGESVKDYVAQLRKLSEHCNFADKLEEHLRDKFVCGLNDGAVQQKLLATKALTLQIAIDTSVAMEAAARSAKQIHGVGFDGQVHRLGQGRYPSNTKLSKGGAGGGSKECFRCASTLHFADKCPFKNRMCYGCKQVGHAKKKCPNAGSRGSGKINLVEEAEVSEEEFIQEIQEIDGELHCLNLYCIRINVYRLGDGQVGGNDPIMISITLNAMKVEMEVDTGAAVSVMSVELYYELNGGDLQECNLRLKTYTGEIMRPLGVGWLDVEYNGMKVKLPIIVLEGSVPTLMGRNWLSVLNIDWKSLFPPKEISHTKPKPGQPGKQVITKPSEVNKLVRTQPKITEKVKCEIKKSGDKKIDLLVEELRRKNPEVLRKCLKLWENKQETKSKISVEDMKSIFPKVFRNELGCLKGVKVNIPIPENTKPKFFKARPVPYALKGRVEDELDKLEGQGVWRKVQYSRWAAPIVVVLKDGKDPTGPIRICGDYKITVNASAPCDTYPIPNTTEQLATLAGGEKFSKIDLSQAYQQLELDDASRELLTVNTHRGLYQPSRLQFGVHSATGIFQREMEKALNGISYVLVRIDDILVTGKDDWGHFVILFSVLWALESSGFTVNLKKCAFFQKEITFCGYTISAQGVLPMQSNVNAVLEAPEPKNVSEVKSFLGMLNYYQNYIPSLSTVAEPIHRLLRKGAEWSWGEKQSQAFLKAKKLLSEAPLLVHFDPSKDIVVHTDASPYGLGSVLSHVYPDNSERPVSYASRSLAVAERNYGHIEKEGLALVFAVRKFHHFLFGHKFTMVTDHKPLLGLFGEHKPIPDRSAARIARWALLLSAYDYKLVYRQGVLNGNADALSRLPLPLLEGDISQQISSVHMMELVHSPVTEKEVSQETSKDPLLSVILRKVLEGWGNETCKEEKMKPFWIRREALSVEGGCLLWGGRVVIPESLRKTVLLELHDVHPGMTRMKALSRSYVWWPKMDEEIEEIAKHCTTCALNQNNPASAPTHPWETPTSPWMRIHMDYAGPHLGKMFLIVVDAYSKWVEVAIMSDATATSTVNKLRQIFATHGLPQVTVSDNGPAFTGDSYTQFIKRNGIKQIYSAPYHPASNGQAERMVRTFKEMLSTLKEGNLQTKVDRLLYKYRIMPHTTTGKTPAQLMFNRELRTPFHLMQPGSSSTQCRTAEDSKEKTRKFEEGALVWARNFQKGEKWIPGVVSKKLGNVTYEISFEGKEDSNRHIDHLRERKGEVEELRNSEVHIDIEVQGIESNEAQVTEVEPTPSVPALNTPLRPPSSSLRRSARTSQPPPWQKDFVTK